MIRRAAVEDIPAILSIEEIAFDCDRLNERNLRHLIQKAHGTTLVAVDPKGELQGYVTVLFNRGTSLARLYSIAVAPARHRQGVGSQLLAAAEEAAVQDGNTFMRLEVRMDSLEGRRFYERHGYAPFAISTEYYEDGVDALRMEKVLAKRISAPLIQIPYYEQTHEFTCGAAALLMAMNRLNPEIPLDQRTELRIWRESTTVFMCSEHGGCGPFGLALSAHRRGFEAEVYVSTAGVLFAESVRLPERRKAMELVQEDFIHQLAETSVRVCYEPLPMSVLEDRLNVGWMALVLISTHRLDKKNQPHWVVVTGFDEQFVYVHDPFVDRKCEQTKTDRMHIPISRKDFGRMARYGRAQLKAAVLLHGTRGLSK